MKRSWLLAPFALAQTRIVAVGDIHGDYANALKVLQLAGVTNGAGNWTGGSATLVQTGDVIDRGPDTIKLYRWFIQLRREAEQAGGRFVMLLGNHELMNLSGNLKDVSDEEKRSFGGEVERRKAFAKDGWIGRFLRTLNIAAKINGTVFVHGGISPKFATTVALLNRQAHDFILNDAPDKLASHALFQDDGPLWFRDYAKEDGACDGLERALKALDAKRMVMGHTITPSHNIATRCADRAFFIDVALSRAFSVTGLAALELTETAANAIYSK